MYGIALTVAACVRAGTRVDVAWIVDGRAFPTHDRNDALAITPGGGRIGQLLSGAADGPLVDLAARQASTGRVVDIGVSEVEALIAGLPSGGTARCVLAPATALPAELWPLLLDRSPVCLVLQLDEGGSVVTQARVYTSDTVHAAGAAIAERFARGTTDVAVADRQVVSVWWPVPALVIAGAGPIAEALQAAAAPLGWRVVATPDPDSAVGLVAGLSRIDHVVVIQHDVEAAGRVLAAALDSDVGYIGSVGAPRMQQLRADWLAYRGIVDLTRVHGPAGLPIGAKSPAEVAIAILAEALSSTHA